MKTTALATTLLSNGRVLLLSLAVPLLLPSCKSTEPKRGCQPTPPQLLSPALAAHYAPYAMMAENAYHRGKKAPYALEKLGWHKIKPDGTPAKSDKPSYANWFGLAADIYRHEKEDRYAFVFRGTNSKKDWLIANMPIGPSFPYKSANKRFGLFLKDQAGGDRRKVVAVGHSLGGGLAGGQSLKYGVDAIMFNTSPRVFDGWKDKWYEMGHRDEPKPKRVAIEKRGEVLGKARAVSTKYDDVMACQTQYFLPTTPGMKPGELHSMSLLAEEIIERAAIKDPSFKSFDGEGAKAFKKES
jgi:hypothetical protein